MVRLVGKLGLALSLSGVLFSAESGALFSAGSLLVAGCASPVGSETKKPDVGGTANGPGPDLGSFVTLNDLSSPSPADMAKTAVVDMAMSAPKDMSMPPADMATPGGCGAITYAGTCTGDILKYCNAGKLVTVDCWATYLSSCKVVGGNADCYF